MSLVPDRVLLHPNFGAEEERDAKKATRELLRLLSLWRALFPEPAEVELPIRTFPPGSRLKASVACSSGRIPERIAREARGLVPWLSDRPAQARAESLRIPLWGPSPEVVRKVHDKAFTVRAARGIAPSDWTELATVLEADELSGAEAVRRIEERVAAWPEPWRRYFVLKPRIGTSGRGRVKGADGVLGDSSRRGLVRLAERGGAVLEPWVERVSDHSVQLWVGPEGTEVLGLTRQILGENGIYLGNRGRTLSMQQADPDRCRGISWVDGPGRPEWEALRTAAHALGETARSAGFTGPCGVDSFLYRAPGAERGAAPRLRPLVELNARFTTGTLALAWLEHTLSNSGHESPREVEWCFLFAPEAAARLLGESVLPRESEGWQVRQIGPEADPAWLALRPPR